MQTLISRFTPQVFQVKSTDCHHHMMRQVYRDCSGVQKTSWKRISSDELAQLKYDCVVSDVLQ